MSRCAARAKVTSSPPSRIWPELGISSPAIMRKVVVLPQPDGPSSTKNWPSPTVRLVSRTATKSPNRLCRLESLISAIAVLRLERLLGEVADDHEADRAGQDHGQRVAEQPERERLHQHDHAKADQHARGV